MTLSRLLLLAFVLPSYVSQTVAQFGIAQKKPLVDPDGKVRELLHSLQVDAATGNSEGPSDQLVDTLLQMAANEDAKNPLLTAQEAVNMAMILQQASMDPDTRQLILKLKTEQRDTIDAMIDSSTPQETIKGMKQAVGEMMMLDYVFEDRERALRLMQEEGMIDPKKLSLYQANPEMLEQDTRTGMYFTFVSLAVAAGFL